MIEGDWLDGPGFVRWLVSVRPRALSPVGYAGAPDRFDPRIGETERRRLRDWRAGSPANFYTANAILEKLNMHQHQIPDELEIRHERPRAGRYAVPDEVRREAGLRYLRGEAAAAIARGLGVDKTSVRNWAKAELRGARA